MSKRKGHRKRKQNRKHKNVRASDTHVRAAQAISIPPESSVRVPVITNFPDNVSSLYVEQLIQFNRNPEDCYGSPDSLISKDRPALHIANFSKDLINIDYGQILGTSHDPSDWLDSAEEISDQEHANLEAFTQFLKGYQDRKAPPCGQWDENIKWIDALSNSAQEIDNDVVDSLAVKRQAPHLITKCSKTTETEDPLAEEPVEGGPKTAKVPPDNIASSDLLKKVDINAELSDDQWAALQEVLTRRERVFGLAV